MHPQDATWMRRALRLAAERAGRTWPNPTVGACVVRDGRLLAEGAHEGPGREHAEAAALLELRRRGISPDGATLYVTLEPCHHQGRTPPCSRAIHAAGIRRVVYAVDDDNPQLPGGGARWLREQGVEVRGGLLRSVAWELNHPFFETAGGLRPHCTLKIALSLDGRMARRRGVVSDPALRRITGDRAHRRVHRMRARASCVLVGRGTAIADRPRLDPRGVGAVHRPRPVILDSSLAVDPAVLPPGALVLGTGPLPPERARRLREAGHEPVGIEAGPDGRPAWSGIFQALSERRLGVVLVEGGAEVGASLLAAGRVDRLHLFQAPRLLGGVGPALGLSAGADRRFRTHHVGRVGGDLEWILRPADRDP